MGYFFLPNSEYYTIFPLTWPIDWYIVTQNTILKQNKLLIEFYREKKLKDLEEMV